MGISAVGNQCNYITVVLLRLLKIVIFLKILSCILHFCILIKEVTGIILSLSLSITRSSDVVGHCLRDIYRLHIEISRDGVVPLKTLPHEVNNLF